MTRPHIQITVGAILLLAAWGLWWALGHFGEPLDAPPNTQRPGSVDGGNSPLDGSQLEGSRIPSAPVEEDSVSPDPGPLQEEATAPALLELILEGRVVDTAGHPLAGVQVERRLDRGTGFRVFDFETVGELPVEDRVQSNSEGRFHFDLPGGQVSHLSARAEGRGEVILSGCMPGEFIEITMPLGATVEGFVSEESSGSPVPDARVRVFHGPGGDSITETSTDPRGYFELRELFPGDVDLQVIPLHHAMPRLLMLQADAGETLRQDVEVDAGWVLAGQVRDRDTRLPIAGAEVSSWSFLGKIARTDGQGRYRLGGNRTRPGTLAARAPGYGSLEVPFGGPSETLDLELLPSRRVLGRVVDAQGEAVPKARITAAGGSLDGESRWNEWKSAESDGEGRFELNDLRSDVGLGLFVRSSGHGVAVFPLPDVWEGSLDVGDLTLDVGILLDGRILDSEGIGISGAAVELLGPEVLVLPGNYRDSARHRSARTDIAGRFRVLDLAPGTWTVTAQLSSGGGSRVAFDDPMVLAPGQVHHEQAWTVPRRVEVQGSVREVGGGPIEGAVVTLTLEDSGSYSRLQTRSAADGSFQLQGSAGGARWTLFTSVPEDRQPKTGGHFLPRATQGLELDGRFLEIELLRAEVSVEGRVVGPEGEAVSGALVSLDPGDGRLRDGVLTDASGAFEIHVPRGTPFTLNAWRTREMDAGDSTNLLRLEWQLNRRILHPEVPSATRTGLDSESVGIVLRLAD